MPFTPFHLGPGAVFKALGGKYFSFMVFGGAQVLIDIEVLVRILKGDALLHGRSHTVLGAAIIGLIAMLSGKPVSELVMKRLGARAFKVSWVASAAGAFVGTFSHVLLDGLLHADMEPGYPFTAANPLLKAVSAGTLHLICVVCGIAGAILIAISAETKRRRKGAME